MKTVIHIAEGVVAVFVIIAAAGFIALALDGYHVGACNADDYTIAQQRMIQTNGSYYSSIPGRAIPATRLGVQWCKPDTNPSDYPTP